MKKFLPFYMALLALLVTGCPHNEYEVELTPHGKVIERKLVFYRENSRETNGVIKYNTFPSDELADIKKLYSPGKATDEGDRHIVQSEFGRTMPADVGGFGTYTNLTTSLGSVGLYGERFRGNPDQATVAANRNKAADELTEIFIGWSKMELGGDPHYKDLKEFLDVDFRRDLKNMSLYWWQAQVLTIYKTNVTEEFAVRFGHHLLERGYLKADELPDLMRSLGGAGDRPPLHLIQRLVGRKLGMPETQPRRKILEFLDGWETTDISLDKYLAGTDAYLAMVQRWEKDKVLQPDLKKPEPTDVMNEPIQTLLGFQMFGSTDDHLIVKLSLTQIPNRTNGRWDEATKQVVWESDLDGRTNAVRLPVFCYASWSQADKTFQTEHFGKVVLDGEDLTQYCLWRDGVTQKQAGEWDAMLAGLKTGEGLMEKLDAFRFSGEGIQPVSSPAQAKGDGASFARELFRSVLGEKGKAGGK
ncbi:MAG: hypothetical protein JWR26_484 [Pedosphaera sp.]|nr:hypothetical protein [Pedosphaera sp.]